jgi:acetate kinase
VRAETAAGLAYLGLEVDAAANQSVSPDADISAPGSAVRVLVITAREDVEIAGQVRDVLGRRGS